MARLNAAGVPMWHMGEHGPSRIVLPFPSGQGTDGEIDQWLAQTRAVARMHGGYGCGTHDGGYEYQQQQRVRQRSTPVPREVPPPARGSGSVRIERAASGPSSIQNLREIVRTSSPPSSSRTYGAGGAAQGREQPRSSHELFHSHELVMPRHDIAPRGVTASGRPTRPPRPASFDMLPVDRPQRSQPVTAPKEPASGKAASIAGSSTVSSASSSKRVSKSQKKVVSGTGKSKDTLIRSAAEYADISIYPRRKAGQSGIGSNRPPVVITRQVLEEHFNMPLLSVCKKLVRSRPCPPCWRHGLFFFDSSNRVTAIRRVLRVSDDSDRGLCLGPVRDGAEKGVSATGGVQVAVQGDQAYRSTAGACDCSVSTNSS